MGLFWRIVIEINVPTVKHVATIAALKALAPGQYSCVVVDGYYAAGDGGGGEFSWSASSSASDNGGTDIELAISHNQGFTWPVHTVVDDQPGCATHFHPSPFLDVKSRLWVSWVDNRDGLGNVYCAVSTNGGVSFSASQLVSNQAFFFTTLIPSSMGSVPAWLGGSQVMSGSNSELYAMWTGAEEGTSNNLSLIHI